MRVVMFYHSLVSDWNNGHAHFLRGVASELLSRDIDVSIFEPSSSWSRTNLVAERGTLPLLEFHTVYPELRSTTYDIESLDLDDALEGADLVIVHEWSDHELVRRVGEHHARVGNYRLLFHDTHHRAVSERESIANYDLSNYDGVLAFGRCISEMYLSEGWARRAWVWHEAADTRVFHPHRYSGPQGDLVWIGNWGGEERAEELREFLLEPVKLLGLNARVYGVRYPDEARAELAEAGIEYGGWLPNYRVPETFARFKLTVHVPRRPYVDQLPGIPTIRPFEALASGIPLVCSPWHDTEYLFTPCKDFLMARDGGEMKEQIKRLLNDESFARHISEHGLHTVRSRHTCAHRVDELLRIHDELNRERTDKEEVVTI